MVKEWFGSLSVGRLVVVFVIFGWVMSSVFVLVMWKERFVV